MKNPWLIHIQSFNTIQTTEDLAQAQLLKLQNLCIELFLTCVGVLTVRDMTDSYTWYDLLNEVYGIHELSGKMSHVTYMNMSMNESCHIYSSPCQSAKCKGKHEQFKNRHSWVNNWFFDFIIRIWNSLYYFSSFCSRTIFVKALSLKGVCHIYEFVVTEQHTHMQTCIYIKSTVAIKEIGLKGLWLKQQNKVFSFVDVQCSFTDIYSFFCGCIGLFWGYISLFICL